MNQFFNRIFRALKLDASLYEEVEADPQAMVQAGMVVVLVQVIISFMLGAGLDPVRLGFFITSGLLSWAIWAGLIYFIGTRFLPEPQTQADWGELLRTLGFASSPGLVHVIGLIIPVLRPLLAVVVLVWTISATVIATRQALDYQSTRRAVFVCVIAWLIQLVVLGLFMTLAQKFG